MVQELPEGTVTVLFTDVEGSTALAATEGDEVARKRMRGCEELVREQLQRHNGREVKGLGDGTMAAFASARRAVSCAIDIQRAIERVNAALPDEAIRLRIGLNSGEVIRERDDIFGSTVNAAARIEGAAAPGQILVSDGVRFLLGPGSDIELSDRGEFEFKGFDEPWRLFEVSWREPGGAAATSAQTPFIGREAERAELRRLLQECEQGRGALVMLGGEPGVGKTRLTEELASEARERGFLTFTGHCYDTDGTAPYIPFVEMLESAARTLDVEAFGVALGEDAPQAAKLMPRLRQLFPDMPPAIELPPEQERRFLLNSMRAYIERAAASQPMLLVFEDLHWADEPTLLLFQHLAQRVFESPLLIAGTYRDTDLDSTRPLAAALGELLRHRSAVDVNLKRLPREGVAAMLRAFGGSEPPSRLLDVIVRETEGNPFFVEQVLKHLGEAGRLLDADGVWRLDVEIAEDEVPRGVRLVIGQRLERVGEQCLRTLTSAAVIGRTFDYGLLRRLSDAGDEELLDAMDEAERAQLISSRAVGGEAQMMFAHEQIRQTLLATLSLPRRQRLHLAVADAIEADGDPDEHAADLAHHLFQAGLAADRARTARYLVLAGDQATATAAFEEALRRYEDALSILPGDDRQGRAELLFKHGLARRSLGRWDDDLDDWEEALTIYEELGEREEIGRLCVEVARHLVWVGRIVDAAAIASRGLAALGEDLNVDGCWLLAWISVATAWAPPPHGDVDAADALSAQALTVARELGGPQLEEMVLATRAAQDAAWWRLRELTGEDYRSVDALRAMGRLWDLAETLSWVHLGLLQVGRLEEADRVAEEVEEAAAPLGHGGALWLSRSGSAVTEMIRTGDLSAFAQRSEELLDFGTEVGIPWIYISHAYVGLVHFWAGRWDDAVAPIERGVELELVAGPTRGQASGHGIRLAAYRGEKENALAMLEERIEHLPRAGRPNTFGSWTLMTCAVESLAVLGERARAADFYEVALDAIETGAIISMEGSKLLESVAGIAAACGEQWDVAERHFETALRQAHELPHVIEQPEVRRWWAWMLLEREAAGDRERARELLSEAITMYRDIGMPKHLEIAEGMLARAAD